MLFGKRTTKPIPKPEKAFPYLATSTNRAGIPTPHHIDSPTKSLRDHCVVFLSAGTVRHD